MLPGVGDPVQPVERPLPVLPRLRDAFAAGDLGWTQVRELIRVATPETEAEWIGHAQEVSCRRLEREVAASRPGDPLPSIEDFDEPPERVVLRFEVAATDAAVIRKGLALLRARTGEETADDGVHLAALARIALRESDCPEQPMPEERYRVVISECPSCHEQTHVGQPDGDHAVAAAVAAEAACDYEWMRLSTTFHPKTTGRPGVQSRDRGGGVAAAIGVGAG